MRKKHAPKSTAENKKYTTTVAQPYLRVSSLSFPIRPAFVSVSGGTDEDSEEDDEPSLVVFVE